MPAAPRTTTARRWSSTTPSTSSCWRRSRRCSRRRPASRSSCATARDSELASQLVQEGDASPADVFLTENTPAMAAVEQAGLFAPLDAEATDPIPEQYRPDERPVDRLRGPLDRARLQPEPDQRGGAAGLDPGPRRPRVGRQGVVLADRRGLPGDRRRRARPRGRGRHPGVAGGAQGQRHRVRRQQRRARGASTPARSRPASIYHYYWYRDQAESGENSDNSQLYFLGNQDPGAFISISGAGVLENARPPGRGAAVRRLPDQRGRPAGARRQLRAGVPARPGGHPAAAGQAVHRAAAAHRRDQRPRR